MFTDVDECVVRVGYQAEYFRMGEDMKPEVT
jgi:hypothetical protein